jgi:hypothetical protein
MWRVPIDGRSGFNLTAASGLAVPRSFAWSPDRRPLVLPRGETRRTWCCSSGLRAAERIAALNQFLRRRPLHGRTARFQPRRGAQIPPA